MKELTELQKKLIRKRIAYLREQVFRREAQSPHPYIADFTRIPLVSLRPRSVMFLGFEIEMNGHRSSGPVHIGEVVRDLFAKLEERREALHRMNTGFMNSGRTLVAYPASRKSIVNASKI